MAQNPDGGERAHLNVEARIFEDDGDADEQVCMNPEPIAIRSARREVEMRKAEEPVPR